MKVLRMSDLALAGKRVLIREDLNVPVKDGVVSSDARIRAALPTLRAAQQQGAHVIVLSGSGYSLMWPDGAEPRRYDWSVGSLIIPPNMWFHQHFNSGSSPARYLAFKHEGVSIRNAQGVPKAWISRRIGGDQIDYIDERPEIRQIFAGELAIAGVTPAMDTVYEAELPDLPPAPVPAETAAR